MSWLAKLDARAARSWRPVRWSYRALKWFFIVMGVYLVVGMAFMEIREGRIGIGTGTVVAVLFGVIKGLTTAVTAKDSPPAP